MPPKTILIGVGGQGGRIARAVHDRLYAFASQQPYPEQARKNVENNLRLFAVDTNAADLTDFPGSTWTLETLNPDTLIRGRTGFFSEWWPEHIGAVGPFLPKGVGQFREKGRLGYFLAGADVAPTITASLERFVGVADDEGLVSSPFAYVYLLGSLAGGTGSGLLLTLAMHLRQTLADQSVRLIGVIPMASVMQLVVAGAMSNQAWANTAAGLREIDWWMTPPKQRPTSITPFFEVNNAPIHGDGTAGQGTPFDICYLFTKQNDALGALPEFSDYTQFIADCIAMELDSTNAQDTLAFDLAALAANPAGPKLPTGELAPNAKPVGFGSLGCAGLVYPAEAITRYLGLQLLENVLTNGLLRPADLKNQALIWVQEHRLYETSHTTPLRDDLHAPYTDPLTGESLNLRARPGTAGLDAAKKSELQATIGKMRQNCDQNWLPRLEELITKNQGKLLDKHRADFWNNTTEILSTPGGAGFPQARAYCEAVRNIAVECRGRLDIELNGDPVANQDGLKQRQAKLEATYENALKEATRGTKLFGGLEKSKAKFQQQWWNPYVETRRKLLLTQAAIHLYDDLITWLSQVLELFNTIHAQLEREQANLRDRAGKQLGASRPGKLVNEIGVLDDPIAVNAAFGRELRKASEPGSDIFVRLTNEIIHSDGRSLRRVLDEEMPPIDEPVDSEEWARTLARTFQAVGDTVREAVSERLPRAEEQFRRRVERISLWEAMTEEFITRLDGRDLGDQWDAERWRYIESRIKACLERAAPFWKLDAAKKNNASAAGTFHTSLTGVAVCSLQTLQNGSTRDQQLANNISNLVEADPDISFNSNYGTGHAFYAMTRERGAPLMFLDEAEQHRMARAEKALGGPRYLDQRYFGVLPPDFEQQSIAKQQPGAKEALLLAKALHANTLRLQPSENGHLGTQPFEMLTAAETWTVFASNVSDAHAKLQKDRDVCNLLNELLGPRWTHAPLTEQRQWLTDIDKKIHTALDTPIFNAIDSELVQQRKTWELMHAVVRDELRQLRG